MNIYLADQGGPTAAYISKAPGELISHANLLQSFFYADKTTESIFIPLSKRFILDSGAFTFMTSRKGAAIDWIEYAERYADFVKKNPKIEGFFELDLDSILGYDKVLDLRRLIEARSGRRCIPVWHRSRGKQEFIEMCEAYDRVAVGGIVTKEIQSQEYPTFKWLIDTAHEHGAKIHGLGFTNLKLLPRYRFDSVDSSSWTSGSRFGNIHRFNGRTMTVTKVQPGYRVKPYETSVNNFSEWLKFSEYAEAAL